MAETAAPDAAQPFHERVIWILVDRLLAPQFVLALVSTIFLWWLTERLFSDTIPDRMREVVSVLVGFITGQMVGPGWQFYFGNTKASDDKTKALADNAAAMRQSGLIPVSGDPAAPAEKPAPVIVADISPYAGRTDDELLQELVSRGEDPTKSAAMLREDRIKLLTDLDFAIPTEPRP